MKIDLTLPKAIVLAAILLVVGGLVWKGLLPVATIYFVIGWLGLPTPMQAAPVAAPVDVPVLAKLVAMHLAVAKEEEAGK